MLCVCVFPKTPSAAEERESAQPVVVAQDLQLPVPTAKKTASRLVSASFSPASLCALSVVYYAETVGISLYAFLMLISMFKDRLSGPVVKAFVSEEEGPGFESRSRRDFSGSSHTSDFKIGTPVPTLPDAWHYRVSAGTGRPSVSIL